MSDVYVAVGEDGEEHYFDSYYKAFNYVWESYLYNVASSKSTDQIKDAYDCLKATEEIPDVGFFYVLKIE